MDGSETSKARMERLLEEVEASHRALVAAEERIARLSRLIGAWVEQGERDADRDVPATKSGVDRAGAADGEIDYFRVISHDLKEPLRGIAYFSQLLADEYGSVLGQEGRDYLGYIRAAAHRMNLLLADGALLSRLRNQPLDLQPTDLEALVNALLDEFRSEIEAKRGNVTREGEFPVLECDPLAMQEVFRRLIKNAVQYSEPPVDLRIEVQGPRDGFFLFSISDRGIGIEPRYQGRVFDLFYRLHSWEDYEGTGAGLTICRRVIEAHGGRIWLESRFGEGTTVSFTVPDTRNRVQRLSRDAREDAP